MRYTAHLSLPENARARLRTVLKLLGGEGIVITAKPDEAAAKPLKPDNTPTSPEALACAKLFGRKPEQEWSDVEIDLFRKARKRNVITIEAMAKISTYYQAERKKGAEGIHRRDLKTFLSNLDGEIDRASAHTTAKSSRRGEWLPSEPKLVVLPELTAEEQAAAARFTAEMDERKRAKAL